MADAFAECLRSPAGFASFPTFQCVFREVVCEQGIADFVATVGSPLTQEHIRKIKAVTSRAGGAYLDVLSLLKPAARRSKQHIAEKTGLPARTVERVLTDLCNEGVVDQTESGSFLLSAEWCLPPLDLWAFELKLNDWKRALFQALQCRGFASYVVVVFPKERKRVLQAHLHKFKNMKVGVMLFDPADRSYDILHRPTKSRPSSRLHYLYAFSQVALLGERCGRMVDTEASAEDERGVAGPQHGKQVERVE